MKKKEKEASQEEKNKPKKISRGMLSKFCAFWGITFAALLFLVNGILQIIMKYSVNELNGIGDWILGIDFVSKLLLLIAVGVPAYGYVSNKKTFWKIIYILAITFYACFCVYRLF